MNLLMIKPMFGIFMLGKMELLLILAIGFLSLIVPVAVVVIVVLILRKSDHRPVSQPVAASLRPVPPSRPASAPAPAVPVPPAAAMAAQPGVVPTKTEVMVRKCPQCGAVLQPDVPEGLCPACLLQRGFATEAGGQAQGQTASAFVPPATEELGRLFPQLEIIECLGRGGMGAVYKARQPRLDRFVALKILAPEKQHDPQFAERFEREARVLARLSHPNIVSVYDFGEVQGRFYLTMEFVDGLTLRQVMQAGKVSPAEALELVPKICDALQYAHGQGIVHRDIKPENILLDKQGRVKIADFGIAKIAGVEAKGLSLTGARDVMGTPVYMAPEQVEKPQSVDHRADIYSLGVVFYELLTGELPLGKFAPPSKKVQVDVRLDAVVLHALEKEPERRYQEASQVKTAVETIAGTPLPLGAGSNPAAALSGAAAAAADPTISDKIILPAFLLAFFLGPFGAHRFYVGKYGTAILQIFTCGGFGIWTMIDWILLACGVFTDADGRRMKNWVHPGPALPPQSVPAAAPAAQGGASPAPSATSSAGKSFWQGSGMALACVLVIVPIFVIVLVCLYFIGQRKAYSAMPGPLQVLSADDLKTEGIWQENGEYWKHMTQTFPLDADGRFSIDNVRGKIDVQGWSSNLVALDATIHGKTGESVDYVKINTDSDSRQCLIHTEQPSDLGGAPWSLPAYRNDPRNNATVDYVVHVPDHARLDGVTSVNGEIRIAGTDGNINASTVNGNLNVKDAARDLKLATVNGAAAASMTRLEGKQSVSFSAVNGELDLTLPEDANARFSVTTLNGNITSDFPSLKPKHEVVGRSLKASLGNGSARVNVNAVNGVVKLLKRVPAGDGQTNAP